jgi:hypothetical protein
MGIVILKIVSRNFLLVDRFLKKILLICIDYKKSPEMVFTLHPPIKLIMNHAASLQIKGRMVSKKFGWKATAAGII